MKSFGVKKKILIRGDNETFHFQVIIEDEMSKIDKLNKHLGIMESSIVVSIQCLVYNHEPFLRDCLEGLVMQKTNFKFEAIVHDDASTDGSADIIREYAEKYPDIIKPIYRTENLYQKDKEQFRKMIVKHYVGKYVAICEGDDYWIDPYKLQKQVDFLEANEEYGLVYTDYKKYYQEENRFEDFKTQSIQSIEDIILENHIPTLTTCFRRDLLQNYLEQGVPQYPSFPFGDYPLWLHITYLKKAYHLADITSVYRISVNTASRPIDINKNLFFTQKVKECKIFFLERYCPNNKVLKQKIENNYACAILKTCIKRNAKKQYYENAHLIHNVKSLPLKIAYSLCQLNFSIFSRFYRFLYSFKK